MCGVSGVQLALDPIRTGAWDEEGTVEALRAGGIEVLSGMMATKGEDYSTLETIRETGGIAPDAHWAANLEAARADAALARRLGIGLVTFHAGFLPHEQGDPRKGVLVGRLKEIAEVFADEGVRVALETGQESAGTLLSVLSEVNSSLASRREKVTVGVNFDPANMILYGMGDPVAALRALAPAVRQIHVKDAVATKVKGTWGSEVCVGTGGVDWSAFFDVYRSSGLGGGVPINLVIEREAGNDRVGDVVRARELVARYAGSLGSA